MTAALVFMLWAGPAAGPWAEAELLATRGQAEAAIEAHQEALRDAPQHAGLHYNLGTLLLEEGRLGPAVVHLLAATRLDPSDEDAAFNLAVASSSRADQLAGVGPGKPWYEVLGQAVPPQTLDVIWLLSWLGLVLALLLSALVRKHAGPRVVIGAAVVVLLVSGLCLSRRAIEQRPMYVVTAASTDAKKAPTDDAAVAFEAHEGLYGIAQEHSAGHVRLRLDNGVEAWFADDALSAVPGVED